MNQKNIITVIKISNEHIRPHTMTQTKGETISLHHCVYIWWQMRWKLHSPPSPSFALDRNAHNTGCPISIVQFICISRPIKISYANLIFGYTYTQSKSTITHVRFPHILELLLLSVASSVSFIITSKIMYYCGIVFRHRFPYSILCDEREKKQQFWCSFPLNLRSLSLSPSLLADLISAITYRIGCEIIHFIFGDFRYIYYTPGRHKLNADRTRSNFKLSM